MALGTLGQAERALDGCYQKGPQLTRVEILPHGPFGLSLLQHLGKATSPGLKRGRHPPAKASIKWGHLLAQIVERTAELDLVGLKLGHSMLQHSLQCGERVP